MNHHTLYQEANPSYPLFYDTQYMYQQHPTLPSPPSSPQFSWQVTTLDEDAQTHTYNEKARTSKTRRTQVPAETMSSLMRGPDPVDGKYVCLYGNCLRRFGRKYNIQSHIQTHLSDRPFRCSVCAAGFVRRHDLVRHARIHKTGKDFVCGCGKGFSRMDALNRHRQRQICVGGIGESDGKSRKSSSKHSPQLGSSGESDGSESQHDSTHSDTASPEPVILAAHATSTTPRLQTFYEDYSQPRDYDSEALLHYTSQPKVYNQDHSMRSPVYVAPVARYPDGAATPKSVLNHDLWVNPSLISPAMTNSSQFYSEGEDAQYYY